MRQTTTDGYVFLQLLIQQVHHLLAIKTVATMDITRYSSYNDVYRYAKEIVIFVKTHALYMRIYTPAESTHFFLTHLDNTKFDTAVHLCQSAIHGATTIDPEYLVPAVAGTIKQLRSQQSRTTPTAEQHRIMCVQDSGEELCLAPLSEEDFSVDQGQLTIDEDGESPFVRSFHQDH